jgi:hypothetical protein
MEKVGGISPLDSENVVIADLLDSVTDCNPELTPSTLAFYS